MLIEQLSITFKCHSAIGNSINLKEMINEVLKTFVSESYAIYSEFLLLDESKNFIKIDSFGRINSFDSSKYEDYKKPLDFIVDNEIKVLKINLEKGILFLVFKNLNVDCDFFISMFESLVPKLNISVNACINFQKIEQTNRYLEEQKKELIKANKTKDDFLANMSHELKTPLNSITVISSIMARDKDNLLNENQLKNMNIIKKCSEDLLVLINDILDISKIEAGVVTVNNEEFNLENVIDYLLDSFDEVSKQKTIELKKEIIGSDFLINSDEKNISQILKNLFSNAVKFTSKGFVQVKMQEFPDFIKIAVIDTGIGIPIENLYNIFDRFKQVDDSITRKFGGTGLGLAISKELANMLFCKLEVSSSIGKGSMFELTIPKDKTHNLNEKEENLIKNNINLKEDNTKVCDKNIMIMNSNSVMQFKFTIALKKNKFQTIPFFNSEELYLKIDNYLNGNSIIIIDDKTPTFDSIFQKYNKDLDFIVISNKKYENVILNLDEKDSFEVLFEQIKNHIKKID